jgi:type IV pilus assembly protein PilN
MKIPINLASQPFRRDRAMLVASMAVAALLVITLGILGMLAASDRQQLGGLHRDIVRLNAQIASAKAEQGRLDVILGQPANASVLERSVFLNTLILHKAISWSQLFSDLEKVLPYNVKLVSLHPYINGSNQVKLDLTLASQQPEPMVEAVRAFEKSPHFAGSVLPTSRTPPTQAEPTYRYRFTVDYAQKL